MLYTSSFGRDRHGSLDYLIAWKRYCFFASEDQLC
jgi:hypothetical protein